MIFVSYYESESEVTQSCPTLCTPWTVAHQAPPSVGFSRQEYWSGLPLPSPGDLPDPGIKPRSPALQADSLPSEPPQKPVSYYWTSQICHKSEGGRVHPLHIPLPPAWRPASWGRCWGGQSHKRQGMLRWGCWVIRMKSHLDPELTRNALSREKTKPTHGSAPRVILCLHLRNQQFSAAVEDTVSFPWPVPQ